MVDDIDLNRLVIRRINCYQRRNTRYISIEDDDSYELHLQWFWFDPIFPNNKPTGTYIGYPGGFWFDPLGWGSDSPGKIKELRTKEIKNGRLPMLAVMGAWFQHIYTGTGPIDKLFGHLADPGHATIFAAFTPK
ncbi:hypothetical protein F2Q68_00045187 [Brassica cretica]|uniref:Chlorophyll a-b binding protein, chloroplastic n=1 Tax=Brassica cretica TaxID=69181 RepID=A0A8S9LKG9_BRACR|nr:hypothetical protein F2Q68_00045187 [Brassica cretica]